MYYGICNTGYVPRKIGCRINITGPNILKSEMAEYYMATFWLIWVGLARLRHLSQTLRFWGIKDISPKKQVASLWVQRWHQVS